MCQKTFQAHAAHCQAGVGGFQRDRQVQPAAGLLKGNHKQTDQDRQYRRADKPDHRFAAHATDGGRFSQAHNTNGQGAEY